MTTEKIADTIRQLGEEGLYKEQGEALLKAAGVLFEARQAVPQLAPRWAKDGKHGIHYSIALARLKDVKDGQWIGSIDEMQKAGWTSAVIEFSFWDSIHNKEEAERKAYTVYKKPKAYDVLASIYTQADSFEDFCANFGYDTDSREAEATYREVKELNAKLENIFTPDELEALQEIR